MNKKLLALIAILASVGTAFAAPALVTDNVPINTLLVADLDAGNPVDEVAWVHANPFIDQGVGDYDLTLANGGILGADLVVLADLILWDGNPNNLDNDIVSVYFTDRDGTELPIEFLQNGVNSLSIDPSALGLLHSARAVITLSFGNTIPDFSSDDAYIYSSSLSVRYDTDLVVNGSGSQVVPAPGATVLASLGCGLVGYLRRRRAL